MSNRPGQPMRVRVASLVVRFAALLALWIVLTEGSMYQIWFGVAVAAGAATLSVGLAPPLGHWLGLGATLRVVPFFLIQALLGGIDVGVRALRRRPLEPTFIDHPLRLKSPAGRLWLTCLVSLLPGTVACELRGDVLHIHVLDRSMDVRGVLDRLERHTAAIFRTPLESEKQ